MAHEITERDGLVLAGQRAWHGLGVVVPEAPTPADALKLASLDWSVEQWPLSATNGESGENAKRAAVTSHVLNVRSDTGAPLGVVTSGYVPTHNRDIAELVCELDRSKDVRLESAGSIRGGKRVWFLAQGESFGIGQDETRRYLLFATGHDGTLAFHAQPTSIRVVCSNTLHMALGRNSAFSFRHSGNVRSKIDEIRKALGLFSVVSTDFENKARALAAKTLTRDEIQAFFVDVYQTTEDEIPTNPSTKDERKKREDAAQVIARWSANFDRESSMSGFPRGSAWLAMNAVTRWYDHQRHYRSKQDPTSRRDARIYGALWGTGADAKATTFDKALALI